MLRIGSIENVKNWSLLSKDLANLINQIVDLQYLSWAYSPPPPQSVFCLQCEIRAKINIKPRSNVLQAQMMKLPCTVHTILSFYVFTKYRKIKFRAQH